MKRSRKRILAVLLTGFIALAEIPVQTFAKEVPKQSADAGYDVLETQQKPVEMTDAANDLYVQEFLEEGVKVTLNDKEGVIPDTADVSITLVKDAGQEYIKGEIQNTMEAVTAERIASSSGEDQTLFGRYYDLTPVVEDVYAVDFEITYMDDAGNLCIFEPKDGQAIEVSIEAEGLSDVTADEMCEAALFHNPDRKSMLYGGRQLRADDAEETEETNETGEAELLTEDAAVNGDRIIFHASHFSVYTVAVIRYAASADSEVLAAQQRAWHIINTYADPDYFLTDPYKSTMKKSQYKELRAAAENAAEGCAAQYDKIKAITEFVAERTYYDYKYISNKKKYPTYFEPYKIYKKQRTVCAGYARLVRTLLISIGIPCMDLIGNNHEYNAAYDSTNQKWIFIDATWDSKNKYTVNGEFEYGGHSVYYFDMTQEQIAKLTSHETYSIDGLLDGIDNSAYYRMETVHDTTTPQDDFIWRKGNWHLIITGAKKKNVKAVSGFADLEVREILDRAFDKNKKLTKIDLSSTNIKSIGYAAFYECEALKSVKVPSALKKIDGFAFHGCTKLKKINLSSTKVKKISGAAFQQCRALESVSFPSGLKKVENYAFFNCSKLKEIDLAGTKVSSLGYAAFYGCNKAKSIYIPSTVKSIGKFAFGCTTGSNVKTSVVTTLSTGKIGYSNNRKYIWARREVKRSSFAYHIKFDGNGAERGTMKNMLCGGGTEYKLSSNKFERDGYLFTGWNTKKNGKGKTYKNNAKIKNLAKKNGKTIKLYAQWKAEVL